MVHKKDIIRLLLEIVHERKVCQTHVCHTYIVFSIDVCRTEEPFQPESSLICERFLIRLEEN